MKYKVFMSMKYIHEKSFTNNFKKIKTPFK